MIPSLECMKRNIFSQSREMLVLLKMSEVGMAAPLPEVLEKAEGWLDDF